MNPKGPISPVEEAETEFNLQRADRVFEDAKNLLQYKAPEQIAAEAALSRQVGLPPEVASRLDPFQVNVATKLPDRERVHRHARQEPGFIGALDETDALKEAPDKYEDFFTIWSLGRQLKGAIMGGVEDKDLGEERAAVGRQISRSRLRGESVSEDLLQKRSELDRRAQAAGELKPLTPTGAVRVTVMAGLQSLDGFMIDTETTDRLAHAFFPEAIAEKIDGPGGPAEKLFAPLYVAAAVGTFGKAALANMAYESYQLEKGNLLYSLQQVEDENGQEIDPELTETIATYYGLIAAAVETASSALQLPIIGRAGAAVKSMIFRKTANALNNPTVSKVARSIVKDIALGSVSESGEEGAQFAAESIATESWKLLSGKFAEVNSLEDVIDAFMQPENLQELKVNLQAGFVGGLGLGSVGGAIRGVDLAKQAKRHQDNQKAFLALAKGIEETDLRERGSGELVAALVSRAGAGKVDKLYFGADQIEEVFNQNGITDANTVIDGLATEIANARTEMRPVEMDAGTFAARLAGSTLFDELKDHIRYTKDDRSNLEMKADREKARETEKTVLEEMESSDRELFEKSSQKVRKEFEKKILEVGRNTSQEAKANAAVFEGIYRSIATAMTVSQKRLVTPEEVLRIYQPLEFQGPDSQAQMAGQQAEEAFAQTVLSVRDIESGEVQEFTAPTPEEARQQARDAGVDVEDEARFEIREETVEQPATAEAQAPEASLEEAEPIIAPGERATEIADVSIEPDPAFDAEPKSPFAAPAGSPDRVRRKLNRPREGRGYRSGKGEPKNRRVTLTLGDGSIITVGRIKPEDWVARIESLKLTPEQIASFRAWYREVNGVFLSVFGEKSPIFAASWLMAQQNESPIGALQNALRVREQVLNGTLGEEGSKKGGVAHERLVKFWKEVLSKGKLEKLSTIAGAQKLYDFVDSALLKARRTWMGNSAEGGEPAVIDVHTARDSGFVDEVLIKHLRARGASEKQLSSIEIDMKGAPTEAQYERSAEWLHEVRDYLNDTGAFGGNFDRVAEVQALGWMALLVQLNLPAGSSSEAIQSRTFRISAEAQFGKGAPLAEKFPEMAEMTLDRAIDATANIVQAALAQAAPFLGDPPILSFSGSVGAWLREANASAQIELLASDEVAEDVANAIGYLLQQTEVWSGRQLRMTPSGKLPQAATDWFVDIEAPELSDRTNIAMLWERILVETKMDLGFSPTSKGIRIYLPLKGNKWGNRADGKKALAALKSAILSPIERAGAGVPFALTVAAAPGKVIKARNDWRENKDGQGYLDRFARRPRVVEALRASRGAVEGAIASEVERRDRVLETFNQLADRGPDQRAAEGRENFRRLGLLGDDGEPIALADLHKGTKNSESAQRAVYRSIGLDVAEGSKPNLKIYPLQRVFGETVEEVEAQLRQWLDSIGWSYGVFGPKNGDRPAYYPDFSDPSTPTYDQKKVWIFDPSLEEGSFRDHAYTLAWRVTHEIAHGIVNDRLTQKYGGRGRRAGAMGVEIKGPYFKGGAPLTLADAMRAVEWEHETFIEQRRILDEVFGVQISDEEFALENGVNMADAVYRSITGQFGNPGQIGVSPTAIDPQQVLSKAFGVLREVSSQVNGDTREVLNQPVYHGTPHIFDRFDLTKIGMGEGNQAFGWGLYFSSSKGIAQFYRESLSGRSGNTFEGLSFSVDGETATASNFPLEVLKGISVDGFDATLDRGKRMMELFAGNEESDYGPGFSARRWRIFTEQVESLRGRNVSVAKPGQLVEADVPESNDLLDWNKPFEEQPQKIQEAIRKLIMEAPLQDDQFEDFNVDPGDRDGLFEMLTEADLSGDVTGEVIYGSLIDLFRQGPRGASVALRSVGIPGLQYDAGTLTGSTTDATNFVIWDEEAISVVQRMQMRLNDEVQGQYERTSAGSIIRMTQASDLTTLLHEAAHFYLSTLSQMVRNGTADDRIRADLDAIMRYTGVSTPAELVIPYADGRQWNGRVDMPHELFARSFEAYLAEGKAPSKELRGVFRRIRSWMAGVYGTLKEVARRLGVQLNPEIRGVFDRMLAVDDAMREAEEMKPLFETREDAGMTEQQWEAYLESFAEIRDEARDRVMQPLVRRVTAEKKRQRRELADSLYDRFAEEVDQEPAYRALRFLRAEEQVEGLEGDGLSREAILALYARPETAAKALASLPRGTVQRTGGHDSSMIAELFGFPTPSALIQALGNAQPREKEIARRVDAEIASRPEFFEREIEVEARALVGGEELAKRIRIELQGLRELAKTTLLPGARRAVAEVGAPPAGASRARVQAAQEALDEAQARGNEEAIARAQIELVAAEATAKAEREARAQQAGARRRAREIEGVLNDQAIRERAETLVANRASGELKSDRRIWVDRMRKEQKAARLAVASRDYLAALRSMERAALLNAMISEADKAIARQPKILNRARSYDTKKQRDKLRTAGAATELGLIDLLLDKYDLRTDTPIDPELRGPDRVREIARRRKEKARELRGIREEEFPSLEKWMAEKKAELEVVAVDESLFLRPDRKHWKELTVAELDGLDATLKNMEQIAKNEVRAADSARKQKYSEMADGAVVAMTLRNVNRKGRNRKEDDLWRGKIRKTIDTVDALHINMKRLFRWMGGDDEATNPLLTIERWWRDATAFELDRIDGLNRKYLELIQELYRSGKDYRSMIDVPAFGEPMTRAQIIAFALNAGTTSNWSKLLRGYKMVNGDQLDEARGNKVLSVLSDEEWTFVQSVWDLVNSLWDEASENHFQMTGMRPEKVESREFITPTGRVMKGGYFPVAYDPLKSDAIARVKERGQLVSLFEHYASDPRTKHGFLEKRKDKFAAPILLDLDLIASHLADVVHDIAWRKPLRDSWKVLHQPQLKSAIVDMYGIEYFDAIEHRIRMLAGAQSSMIKNLKWMQNGLQKFQSAQTAYMLAGAFSTTFVQLSSFTNAIPRIADGNVREGTGLIAKGLWLVVTDFKATKAKIHSMSALMRHRAKAMDTSVREANAELEGRTDRIAKARRLGYSMIAAADYFVSGSVFLARYEKVLSETMDPDRAMREAEFAVERTQGAGNVKDMAQIQDADPLFRPFTMFYSYFSAFYNELHSMAEDVSGGKIKKAASAYLLIAVIPGMLSDLIRFNVPDEDDEDEQAKAWALWAAYHLFANPFSSVIGIRDLASFATDKLAGRAFARMELTPLLGFFDQMARTIETIGSAVGSDDDINPYEVAEEITAGVGMAMGLPFARQLNIIANNLAIAHDEGLELGMKDLLVRRRRSE